jgi:hypothetical protein
MTILPDPPDTGMEINILRNQTHGYIAFNPVSITVMRASKVDDGAGGKRSTRTARPPQTVRIIQQQENNQVLRVDQEGNNVRPDLNMMMEWDGDVQSGDQFDWSGFLCEVIYVQDMDYEKMCEVLTRGRVGS